VCLKASVQSLSVNESDRTPVTLVLTANFPITCQSEHSVSNMPLDCWMKLRIDTEDVGIAMRQRNPGVTMATDKAACLYYIYETDWDSMSQTAAGRPLEVVTKVGTIAKHASGLSSMQRWQ